MKRDKLTSVIAFRVPQEVGDQWRKRASYSGMNLGDWVRSKIHINEVDQCITKKQTPRRGVKMKKNFKPTDPVLLGAIGRVGNNLNQITKQANTYLRPSDYLRLQALLLQIRDSVERLRC